MLLGPPCPAVDDAPTAPRVHRLDQPTGAGRAAGEDNKADIAAWWDVRPLTEIDLGPRHLRQAGPAVPAIAGHIERPAPLPDDREAVIVSGDPDWIAVSRDAAVATLRWPHRRVGDAHPTATSA